MGKSKTATLTKTRNDLGANARETSVSVLNAALADAMEWARGEGLLKPGVNPLKGSVAAVSVGIVEGEARIAMRKVLTDETHVFHVNGDAPAYVDMPTLWTHNITNTGTAPLVTLFWTHDIFDPSAPDTYADKVGEDAA